MFGYSRRTSLQLREMDSYRGAGPGGITQVCGAVGSIDTRSDRNGDDPPRRAAAQTAPDGRHPARKLGLTLALTVLLFVCVELALQVRSHIRYGQSVFNALTAETRYVEHPETGLLTLRPDHVFRGNQVEIRTNSLGLRSEPITVDKPPATVRIAVVGASTVMGAYAATNEETFSYRLEALLDAGDKTTDFQVINAGIAGYDLHDQRRMIEKLILPFDVDLIVIYPGFNDFAAYCRNDAATATKAMERVGLPLLQSPEWLLSVELVRKNTVSLRTAPESGATYIPAHGIDLSPYRAKLDGLLAAAKATGARVVIATNARAYRPEQALDEQLRLSETARYYTPCFDISGLHTLYDRHNREIAAAAARHEVSLVPLGERIPGGRSYFVDASHFSSGGEQMAAEQLHRHFIDHALIARD